LTMLSGKSSINESFRSAKKLFDAGEMNKAADICRDIHSFEPENTEAHYLLGIIADKNGNTELTVELIGKVTMGAPDRAIYYNNLCKFDTRVET